MHLSSVTFHPEKYPTRDRYPFNLSIYHGTKSVAFVTPVTLFVGENGSGKSTLIEALANKCGIHIWREVERRRFGVNPYETAFSRFMSVEWSQGPVRGSFFGSSVFQDFAKALDEWAAVDPGHLEYFGGKSLMTQSHGQSIMSYFRSRYRIKGLYLLDEPETALSPKTQLELLELLSSMGAAGHAQFIMATHSPILLACPGATIYSFDRIPIGRVAYEETEHFKIYRSFLEDRKTHIDKLREERRS
jgi:predicted ATPase